MSRKLQFQIIGILGGTAVALGAFGSHGFKEILVQNGYTEVFQTANRYHFYHIFALALISVLPQNKITRVAFWCFLVGILIFSGSLYVLALTQIKVLGAITPVGGIAFIIGWLLVGLSIKDAPNYALASLSKDKLQS
ncbi:DUF423 domain-containing protein [Raineya orbicola]|jgi:uncharacterized membrane protein YgdD (TMEM256/DUF423 family)|uniref:Putative small membrane protein n=1 Tax=Raineya orbicola TaxID=2016530 RepID=A0A2N3IHQ7_9BACT|nr:DUF423 domain-containing protein [Raineya orbicola]PKQ69834.1 putative small membrane protein [Raineya orbicola]